MTTLSSIPRPSSISRRDLLKTGSTLVVSFTLGLKRSVAQTASSDADLGKPVDPKQVDTFLAVHADGSVTVYTGKVDLGTGLRVAIRQMAAEELGVPVERVELIEGDTALTPDQGATGGSTGLTRGGVEVRQAAATARQALLKLGADRLNRPASELALDNGQVHPIAGGVGVGIGDLIGGKKFAMSVDANAPLKPPASYNVVGKPVSRPDIPAKCTAKHTYIQDFSVPGMLHGRVIRPPSIGSKVVSVDESSIRAIPDVRVVRIENFVGVVARDEWAAVRAARDLKVVWSDWQGLPGNAALDRYVRAAAIDKDQPIVTRGDTAPAMTGAAKKFSATYYWPNQSHASLGPSCAIADIRADRATIWTASQATHNMRENFTKVFDLPKGKVRVIYLDGAGCYGGNGNDDAAADAALLSKTVGQPVRVQWMRQEEHGWDPKGPQQLLDLRAGTDAQGNVLAWETEIWVPTGVPGARPLLAADAAGIAQDHGQGAGLLTQNCDPPYAASNVKVVAHLTKETPLRPSNLRAPGKIGNVFAVESFTDEIAASAGVDPVAYRLDRLKDPRAIEVIKKATEMFGWQKRPSPNSRALEGKLAIGRGVAYARYKQAENYVAMAMEVAVDRSTGQIAVRRVTCAHDCGLIVNPDALRNQVEGLIVQTLSRTLHEEVKFDRSRVTSIDWMTYPILRFPEVPQIEVALIDRPELPLLGAGEAAGVTVGAALGNAVFDATGVRLRTAPFTPERVKAALTAE
ncbi:MAG TPA: molybdopterin cofactor-binding domain-containing protein [Bryobacteraceae bacterium]|nr:molybdopterin cofactor-binding domain-containing protein [Bryobacteraceae bacterium]